MTQTPKPPTLASSHLPGLRLFARGKVRDVYETGEHLLIVATDRLSAFDVVLPTPIPAKGEVLTQLSAFWFEKTAKLVPNHFVTADFGEIRKRLPDLRLDPAVYKGRTMLARKAVRADCECVVRGYLAGSGWKEYLKTGSVCGHILPKGLREAERLSKPLFTPTTKASEGHDESITRERLADLVGAGTARELERLSLALYERAAEHAERCGLLLADTKFEFGHIGGRLAVIDELLTPDSSRFWEKDAWKPGATPASFDKQFVRDWLETGGWDKRPPAPELPADVVEGTSSRYREALRRLTA
ncbi:MAG TPA: phosphoribosylaminoimidazolesuccinocarboxamide synthase [Elusimicrobia bacterium]|nr:phosphoribosylaminoimidazolesuccinocarboxamide synthase [Elusimicrobiota bacterium]